MKNYCLLTFLLFLLLAAGAKAQPKGDIRCLQFMGIPLEGPADSVAAQLKQLGFTEWGMSDDQSEQHFRGSFYGLRSKLILSSDVKTGFVTSVYVSNGPYGSKPLFNRNLTYYQNKLEQDYGKLTLRNDAYYHVNDYGIVKLSGVVNETGSQDIKVFFFCTAPYYKDVFNFGLRGNVMEVVTDNPVMENPVEQFDRTGRTQQSDLVDRCYDRYGYLTEARMKETTGYSVLSYEYDDQFRLSRRTLTNEVSGLRSVNEYTYNEDGDIATQSQKVFDKTDTCVLSILLKYSYDEDDYDDNGNWTRSTVELVYWEKDGGTQTSSLVQTRKISYWDD